MSIKNFSASIHAGLRGVKFSKSKNTTCYRWYFFSFPLIQKLLFLKIQLLLALLHLAATSKYVQAVL